MVVVFTGILLCVDFNGFSSGWFVHNLRLDVIETNLMASANQQLTAEAKL